jgi:3-deoxy-D-manno-octulosonate 8-phosphate phosphatase (KDO 8-P phosphatase)
MNKRKCVRAVVLDIDGVLTDGTVAVAGDPCKRVYLRDLDALTVLRSRGIPIAFLTGETAAAAAPVVERCGGGEQALYGCKDKEAGLREISARMGVDLSELCYLADGRRDVPALKLAGLALCPADGDRLAKNAAHIVLAANGGRGAVAEAVDLVLSRCGMAEE